MPASDPTIRKACGNRDAKCHPSWTQRTERAIARLEKLGIRRVDELVDTIMGLRAKDRLEATWVLFRTGRRKHIPLLLDIALNDRSGLIRSEAILALGDLGGKKALRGLLKILRNSNESVEIRNEACYALAFMHDKECLDDFLHLLQQESKPVLLRAQAAEGIANLLENADRRTKPWRRSLQILLPLLNASEGELRFWTIFALAMARAKAALPTLKELARRDTYVSSMGWSNREEAKDAIAVIETGHWPEPDAYERSARKKSSRRK